MNRCTLVAGMVRSGAIWTDRLSFESAGLDWQSQTDAFVRVSTHATSTDCYGACKHPQQPAAPADVAV